MLFKDDIGDNLDYTRNEDLQTRTEEEANSSHRKKPTFFKGRPRQRHRDNQFVHSKVRSKGREHRRENFKAENIDDKPMPEVTGCHQVCNLLIFEVYKLLRGKHCDC